MLSERIKDLILIRLSLLRLLLYDIVFLIYFEFKKLQQMTPQFWRWSTFYSTLLTMIQICKNFVFQNNNSKNTSTFGNFCFRYVLFWCFGFIYAVLVFIKLHWKLNFFLFTFYAFLFVFLLTENITLKSWLIWFYKKKFIQLCFF